MVSEVSDESDYGSPMPYLYVLGAVVDNKGNHFPGAEIRLESMTLDIRVLAAMKFLRLQCDKSGSTGF